MRIQIDLTSDIPIYKQIRDEIVLGIAKGELKNGDLLPSVRQLALDLGINHMTVNKAYQLLKQESYVVTDRSKGTLVSSELVETEDFSQAYIEDLKMILAEGLSKTDDVEAYRSRVHNLLDQMILERRKR